MNFLKRIYQIKSIEKDITKTKICVDNIVITDRLLDYLNTECMLLHVIIDSPENVNGSNLKKLQCCLKSRRKYQRLLSKYATQSKDYHEALENYLADTNMKYVVCANRSLQSADRKKAEYKRRIEFLKDNKSICH